MIFEVLFMFIAVGVIVFGGSLLFIIFMDDDGINNPFLILWVIESFILTVLISCLVYERVLL